MKREHVFLPQTKDLLEPVSRLFLLNVPRKNNATLDIFTVNYSPGTRFLSVSIADSMPFRYVQISSRTQSGRITRNSRGPFGDIKRSPYFNQILSMQMHTSAYKLTRRAETPSYPISGVELHIRFGMEIDTETRLISTRFGFPSGPEHSSLCFGHR